MTIFDNFNFFDVFPRVHPLLLSGGSYSSLPLKISSTSTHYIVRTELPGIPQNQISVDINEDGLLNIQAEREEEKEKTKDEEVENEIVEENWVVHGKLQHSIKFPKDDIDVDGVKAELNNGELIIKVLRKKTHDENKRSIKISKGKL